MPVALFLVHVETQAQKQSGFSRRMFSYFATSWKEEGRKEGRQEGRQEGQIARIHSCERLLRRALTPVEQLCALGLPQLEHLADRLEAEAIAKLTNHA